METVTSADGTTIAYDRSGSGPALILVAGAFSDRNDPMMAGLAKALEPSFTVFNYDRRGRGDSGDNPAYAVQREVEDIQALIDEAGEPACVFGGSSGGGLVLEAVVAGAPISKLAVFEPPYVADTTRPPLPSEQELSALVASGRRGEAIELFLTKGAELPVEAVAQMKASPFWPATEAVAHTLPYEAAIVGPGPVPAERFARVTTATLVLVGADSPDRMQGAAQAVTDAVPGARLERLAGQSHGALESESFAAVLTGFFTP